jgi:hypothetical protein
MFATAARSGISRDCGDGSQHGLVSTSSGPYLCPHVPLLLAPALISLIVWHMTGWPDLVVGDLLGGISGVLGTPPPLAPAPTATIRVHICQAISEQPCNMGIDPDIAPMDVINKALAGSGNPPARCSGRRA